MQQTKEKGGKEINTILLFIVGVLPATSSGTVERQELHPYSPLLFPSVEDELWECLLWLEEMEQIVFSQVS